MPFFKNVPTSENFLKNPLNICIYKNKMNNLESRFFKSSTYGQSFKQLEAERININVQGAEKKTTP